ncbi:MAG: ATP-binding cassette, subfamily B [Candidatus Electronema aureum]|uniref:Multidrug resistance-like ATP-binding protein MdlB n=1 Tax=Candidatus Electronema aureum TaxID=2005002 RepID=A0A521G1T0_9BACT|nr:MAG: ATP-binding cassette, subfamily B [Candidatus Electronema aureum]
MRSFGYFEESKVGRVSDLRLWRRIIVQCWEYRTSIIGGMILSLLITAAAVVQPQLLQRAIDSFMTVEGDAGARLDGVFRISLLYGFAAAVAFAAGFAQVMLLEYIGQSVMQKLRSSLFSHLLSLDLAFFHAHPAGRLVTRLTNDIQNMNEMFTLVMVTIFNDILKLVCILAVLYLTNVRLALLMTVFLPLSLALTLFFSKIAREGFRAIRSQLAVVNAFLQEQISAVSVLQLYARESDSMNKFRELNQVYLERNLHLIRLFGAFMPLTEVLSALATASVLWYGGGEVLRQQLTLGELTAFLAYMRLFFQPMQEIARKYSVVQSALASAERIFELLDISGSIMEPAVPLDGERIKGDIRFEQVSFTYQEEDENGGEREGSQTVLREVDLHIKAGETIAITGPTGAGKTTLVSLLVRFYDPAAGRILLDGHDLREFAPQTLRRKIGLVLQDPLIEPDTVLANIRQDTHLNRSEIYQLLVRTGLDAFIARLPQGLDTRIGEGGLDLSAGEKQLLAFARVLCRDPAVLILDEATSSVDSEAEQMLEQAVRSGFAGRTLLVIAHRLSTVRQADRIAVFSQGRLTELGSHDELLKQQGLYAELVTADRAS